LFFYPASEANYLLMKRLIFTLLAIIFTNWVSAQAKQEAVSSAGGYNTGTNISLSWTLGELIVPTFSNGNLTLAHGFQQQLIVTAIEENLDILVKVKVYPNPASEYITIQFEEPVDKEVAVTLIDAQGRLVKSDLIEPAVTEKMISMQELSAGIYYLRLIRGKLVNVYKVVKL